MMRRGREDCLFRRLSTGRCGGTDTLANVTDLAVVEVSLGAFSRNRGHRRKDIAAAWFGGAHREYDPRDTNRVPGRDFGAQVLGMDSCRRRRPGGPLFRPPAGAFTFQRGVGTGRQSRTQVEHLGVP